MPRIMSEDDGKTWRELPPIGGPISKNDPFRCIMTFSSIVRLKDGSHSACSIAAPASARKAPASAAIHHARRRFHLVEARRGLRRHAARRQDPCEPYVFRSPDGDELCCIMRENRRSGTSLVMFSRDEGKTWSQAVDAPWGLTGDRHHGIRLPDGRLVIVFRNASPNRRTRPASSPGSAPTTTSSKAGPASIASASCAPSKTVSTPASICSPTAPSSPRRMPTTARRTSAAPSSACASR